jgi:hypothetical protein
MLGFIWPFYSGTIQAGLAGGAFCLYGSNVKLGGCLVGRNNGDYMWVLAVVFVLQKDGQ